MNKSLALLIVASLLLAGCTELTANEDGETMNIEVNEDIAIDKINDFMTVDEDESFGITMMYEMDPSETGFEVEDDSEAVITIEMTEAWSPDGYHSSSIMGLAENESSIKFVTSVTHIGTTMYVQMGYETVGDVCEGEDTPEETEMCEMMYGDMPAPQAYSMTTTTTHTEVIAAMAEETSDNSEDLNPLEMLEFFTFVECSGTFTPVESVDGLQIFSVSMEGMDDERPSAEMALCMADTDGSGGVSLEEFTSIDETDEEDMTAMQAAFDEADANSDGELTVDELGAFIDSVDEHYLEDDDDSHDGDDHGDDHDDRDDDVMPDMAVAFNNAGEIEYFEMGMDGTVMKMYVLSEERVDELFSSVDAGELVALPFTISSDDDPWAGDDYFYCDDGESIPMDWVNDGIEDCAGGEDETDMSGYEEFMCDDGETIPMDYVNDGIEDCNGGEDETGMDDHDHDDHGDDHGESHYDGPTFICGDGVEIPFDYVNDGMDDCDDGADEQQYDTDGNEINWFDCMDGSQVWISDVNDGVEDCPDGDDEMHIDLSWEPYFGGYCEWEGDSGDEDRWSCKDDVSDSDWDTWWYYCELHESDWFCTDDLGQDSEFENSSDGDLYDGSYDHDGDHGDHDEHGDHDDHGDHDEHGDHDDHGDHDAHDEDGHDEDEEIVMYITSEMDFYFEGDMSDYKIELASCDYDYDMETGEETRTCTTVMSVAVVDAGMDSSVMFHDADSSGTISVGDMIHIGETGVEWDEVRLYSISADAYSDENPMHNAPGFTGLVGMLALLGAAFIRRNE